MSVPYHFGETLPISLDPRCPAGIRAAHDAAHVHGAGRLARLQLRLRHARRQEPAAEMVLIPVLDVLQSVPILGFLSITVTGFIALFPGSLLGAECAAIFAIFTSQAWNMAFSFYQSLRTVPARPRRGGARVPPLAVAALLAARGAVRHARPHLEHDDVDVGRLVLRRRLRGDHRRRHRRSSCPASAPTSRVAIEQRDLAAIGYAVLAMLIVILLYDQLLFRPLVAWARQVQDRESAGEETPRPWFSIVVQRARIFDLLAVRRRRLFGALGAFACAAARRAAAHAVAAARRSRLDRPRRRCRSLHRAARRGRRLDRRRSSPDERRLVRGRRGVVLGLAHRARVARADRPRVAWSGCRSASGSGCGRGSPTAPSRSRSSSPRFRPTCSSRSPSSLILRFRLNAEIWLSPLMILGTQWYILFNVIAGASALPDRPALRGRQSRRLAAGCGGGRSSCPAIFPPISPAPSPPPAARGTPASSPRSSTGATRR